MKRILQKEIDNLNRENLTNTKIIVSRYIPMKDTNYDPDENTIYIGVKDTKFSNRKRGEEKSVVKITKVFQYFLHEYFHSLENERFLTNPKEDPLMTLDIITTYLFNDLYIRNHTISLNEVYVERESWKRVNSIIEKIAETTKIKMDFAVMKNFYNKANEFYTEKDKKLLEKVIMVLSGKTIYNISKDLDNLEQKSRKTKRIKGVISIEKYVGKEKAKDIVSIQDPVLQIKELIKAGVATNSYVEMDFERICLEFPKLREFIFEREPDKDPGSRR